MAEILGLGVTHYPGLLAPDDEMHRILLRALKSSRVPAHLKDPASWPAAMRQEWEANRDGSAVREHRARCAAGFRAARQALEEFRPDFVLVWGDDQYENFREDGIPPFCVFALDQIESMPFRRKAYYAGNYWNAAADTPVRAPGHRAGGSYLAAELLKSGFDISYAYSLRYDLGLAHAFVNTILLLEGGIRDFPYPLVPFHVNCYGSSLIRTHGGQALDEASARFDPPSPSPSRCFDLGAAVARALAASPWRVALIASSSWSHAFLCQRNHGLWPDQASDRARLEELRRGDYARWRDLTTAELEDAGQHEFLNWICLAGAMHALGRRVEIVDYVESCIFNSDKCFAIFPPEVAASGERRAAAFA